MENNIESFTTEKQCEYKGEIYSVRDNGKIKRHPRKGKRQRKDDNIWTFGKKNEDNGYMYIGGHRIHIIVATAFYGGKDSKIFVVDHIDTNRCNNRVENLRWLTRLENALLNPDTIKRIKYLCDGDIQKFIHNPSCLRDLAETNKDLTWMRTVTPEEAANAYNNIMAMAQRPTTGFTQNKNKEISRNTEWIFEKHYQQNNTINNQEVSKALTPQTALQMNWKTPTEFPCCPASFKNHGLSEYFDNMIPGKIFSKNKWSAHEVIDKAYIENESIILVITKDRNVDALKPFGLIKILFSGEQFIHESVSTFFEKNGVRKRFIEIQGLKWDGEDSIDNYCN